MFFFIAGMQPKTIKLEKTDIQCPNCMRYEVYRQRQDEYFSLFFVPMARMSEGREYTACAHCQRAMGFGERSDSPPPETPAPKEPPRYTPYHRPCRHCGQIIEPEYSYCPFCGKKL